MLHHLLLDKHALSPPDSIAVCFCDICLVRLLAQVFELLDCSRHPEGILIKHLKAGIRHVSLALLKNLRPDAYPLKTS